MCWEVNIKLEEEPEEVILSIREFQKILEKVNNYRSLWRLFSVCNKILVLINFITIILSIFIEGNLTLALSVYTLSFHFIFEPRGYIPTLEKLLNVYQDRIIIECKKYIRDAKSQERSENEIIDTILEIERSSLIDYMGQAFTLSNTLRGMDCKRILCIALAYIISFAGIAVACYYKKDINNV